MDASRARIRGLLISLGFELLRYGMSRAARRAMPEALLRIDAEIPDALSAKQSPVVIRGLFASALADATGRPALEGDVKALTAFYDPAINALRRLQRR